MHHSIGLDFHGFLLRFSLVFSNGEMLWPAIGRFAANRVAPKRRTRIPLKLKIIIINIFVY